jgi:hypothetical protein
MNFLTIRDPEDHFSHLKYALRDYKTAVEEDSLAVALIEESCVTACLISKLEYCDGPADWGDSERSKPSMVHM